MGMIDELRVKFSKDEFEFSKHATDIAILRDISVQEIRDAVASGEIIEDYPDDKYGPSCLIFGFTGSDRPIHVHCTYASRPIVIVVTVYEPEPAKWVNYRARR